MLFSFLPHTYLTIWSTINKRTKRKRWHGETFDDIAAQYFSIGFLLFDKVFHSIATPTTQIFEFFLEYQF